MLPVVAEICDSSGCPGVAVHGDLAFFNSLTAQQQESLVSIVFAASLRVRNIVVFRKIRMGSQGTKLFVVGRQSRATIRSDGGDGNTSYFYCSSG